MQSFGKIIPALFLFCILLCGGISMSVKTAAQPGDHALTFESSFDATEQPYRLYLPTKWTPDKLWPVAVVLHGKTVDQNAWFDFTPVKEYGEKYGYVLIAPYGRGDYFYQGPGEQDVLDLVDIAIESYNGDPNRIHLMGHSMGGWGTWWVALRHPHRFASISPMAGFDPMELIPNARHLAPYIIHDSTDPIVSVEHSRSAAKKLEGLGYEFHYREESGYGHESRMIGDNLDRVFEWFNRHPRVTQPEKVSLVARTPRAGRAYWIQILETIDFPQPASVEAEIKDSGQIFIETGNLRAFAIVKDFFPSPEQKTWKVQIDDSSSEMDWDKKILRAWEIKATDEEATAPESATVAAVETEPKRPMEFWMRHAGQILVKQTGADFVLLTPDMFPRQASKGPVTEDEILDLYLYSEKRLGRLSLSGQVLEELQRKEAPFGKEWWGQLGTIGLPEIDAEQFYTVIAPLHIIRSMEPEAKPLKETIPVLLYRGVSGKKDFVFD